MKECSEISVEGNSERCSSAMIWILYRKTCGSHNLNTVRPATPLPLILSCICRLWPSRKRLCNNRAAFHVKGDQELVKWQEGEPNSLRGTGARIPDLWWSSRRGRRTYQELEFPSARMLNYTCSIAILSCLHCGLRPLQFLSMEPSSTVYDHGSLENGTDTTIYELNAFDWKISDIITSSSAPMINDSFSRHNYESRSIPCFHGREKWRPQPLHLHGSRPMPM